MIMPSVWTAMAAVAGAMLVAPAEGPANWWDGGAQTSPVQSSAPREQCGVPDGARTAGLTLAGGSLTNNLLSEALIYERERDGQPLLAYGFVAAPQHCAFLVGNQLILSFASTSEFEQAKARVSGSADYQLVEEHAERRILLVQRAGERLFAPADMLDRLRADLAIHPLHAEPNQLILLDDAQDRQYEHMFQPFAHFNRGDMHDFMVDADIDANEVLSRLALLSYLPPQPVMVMDTGVDVAHVALRQNLWTNARETPGDGIDNDGNGYRDDIHGWNFAGNNSSLFDPNSHGTHVAGIIAAQPHRFQERQVRGVAPSAQIVVAKIDIENPALILHIVKALDYARLNGIRIVNMSFHYRVRSAVVDQALSDYNDSGGLAIVSAGNARPGELPLNLHITPVYPCASGYPICVASTDYEDGLSNFSNYGARSAVGTGVAIAAPGEGIVSTVPGQDYQPKSGTSMSAPMVAGAAAAIWAVWPAASQQEVYRRLIFTADRVASLDPNKVEDGRRLNLYHALFGRPDDVDPANDYCSQEYFDTRVKRNVRRNVNEPFANSGEQGIDGRSDAKAFTLCNVRQIAGIKDAMLDRHFRVARNIDWTDDVTGARDTSIGDPGGGAPPQQFRGVIEGYNYAIIGFHQRNRNQSGLVARLGPGAEIRNLRFHQAKARASSLAATVATFLEGGKITNVQVEGTVTGPAAGGLVGRMTGGEIRFSTFEGAIQGSAFVGGLVAQVAGGDSRIENSLFSGTIDGEARVGGIAGEMGGVAFLRTSHANLVLRSQQNGSHLGGLVGYLFCGAGIEDSYAEGSVRGKQFAGALVGRMANAHLVQAYASVLVSPDFATTGGAIGEVADDLRDHGGRHICHSNSGPYPAQSVRIYDYYDMLLAGNGTGTPMNDFTLRQMQNFQGFPESRWMKDEGKLPRLKQLPRSTHAYF